MKHIDTGMGFERIVRVLQNKSSNYETDIFSPLITKISEITGKEYSGENVSSMNAIADHIRSLTFAISDGAMPSNEGRGYVLRRILRRASRLARKLDYNNPILFQLVETVVENFGEAYPELIEKKEFCKEVIKAEEESFHTTLDRGLKLFNDVADSLKNTKIFPGDEAFKLYDTFGFPLDLTEVMAREKGLKVDLLKFEEDMEKQKNRGRKDRKDSASEIQDVKHMIAENYSSNYNPYEINADGVGTDIILPDENGNVLVIENNPFYSESGGQISDTGLLILSTGEKLNVIDSKKDFVIVESVSDGFKGKENLSEYKIKGIAKIDIERRFAIERNHSATHILHEALRRVLGSHVKQLGSLVHNEYLRFDFPHFHKVEDSQIKEIEDMVNSKIQEEIKVNTDVDISIEEANKIPNVKIVMILRDPVERLYSQFLMNLKLGKIKEKDLLKEIEADQQKQKKGWGVSHLYLEVGNYYEQVKRYYDQFPKEQIKVILFDDFKKDAKGTMKDLFKFLGVDPEFELDMSKRYNEAGMPRFGKLNYWLTQIGVYGLVKRIFPPDLKNKIKGLIYSQENIPKITEAEKNHLKAYYREDRAKLASLIGRDLSNWD